MCEFSENGFGSKKKLFSRPLDLETVLPPIWGGSPSNLGRFEKVDFSLVFLSDLSHCISLSHLYLVWFPNPLAAGSQMGTLSIFIIRWCARHLFLNWHWPKLNCLGQTIQLQIVFSVLTRFRTSQSCQQAGRWCRGGVWTLYLAITAHFTSWWLFQMYFRRCTELWGGRPRNLWEEVEGARLLPGLACSPYKPSPRFTSISGDYHMIMMAGYFRKFYV